MAEEAEVLQVLQEIWSEATNYQAPFPGLDEPLSENEDVDSLTIMDVVAGLEKSLEILIPDDLLVEENIGTMRLLLTLLQSLIGGRD